MLTAEVASDCGCNKIKREEIQIHKADDLSTADDSTNTPEACPMGSSKLKELMHENIIDADSIADMALIPGGAYSVGTDAPVFINDRESPARQVEVDEFYLDLHEVSNKDFLAFVEATKYVTEAEKFGDSFVFQGQIEQSVREENEGSRVASAKWWYKVKGVNWRHPTGSGSAISAIMDHPVVHVSWKDASKYCAWQDKRLPTEEEWETACRGGKKDKLFPWGNKLMPKDHHWYAIFGTTIADSMYKRSAHLFQGQHMARPISRRECRR